MKNNADEIRRLKERLGQGTLKTVIIPHISADGDAAGSCSALSEVLQQVGIEWHILTCDFIPEYLRFLKNISWLFLFRKNRKNVNAYLPMPTLFLCSITIQLPGKVTLKIGWWLLLPGV